MDYGKFKYEADQREGIEEEVLEPDGQGNEVPAQDRARRLRHQDQKG